MKGMTRLILRAAPIGFLLAFGAVSCSTSADGSMGGCGAPEECGPGTFWTGSQCVSKAALCGPGTSYDEGKDRCVRGSHGSGGKTGGTSGGEGKTGGKSEGGEGKSGG